MKKNKTKMKKMTKKHTKIRKMKKTTEMTTIT